MCNWPCHFLQRILCSTRANHTVQSQIISCASHSLCRGSYVIFSWG
jgi:hypothetical protein